MYRKSVILLSYVAIVPMCAAQPNQLESAIERLDQLRSGEGAQVLDECIASIRHHMAVGDFATWRRLRAILEKAERPAQVQLGVLDIAAEKADERIALDLLALARGWVEALSPEGRLVTAKDKWETKAALVYRFLDLLEGGPVAKHLGSHPETLEMLRAIATDSLVDPQKGAQAIELIYNSKAPLALSRAAAEAIVAARRNAEAQHPLVLKLLDSTSVPKLRELLKQSEDPLKFHLGSAAALAHLGDIEIKDEVKRLSAEFNPIDRNLGGILEYFVWQIEIQQSTTKLLEYIASDRDLALPRRLWAVHRAVELGVAREMIRAALLEHASKVEPRAHRQRTGRTVTFWPGLSTLKKEALELGLLQPDDLPEIRSSETEPAP